MFRSSAFFSSEVINLHRVVDHQINWYQRFDVLRVLAQFAGDVAHCGQIGQQWHTGKVLQHDACHDERNFVSAGASRAPAGELLDVFFRYFLAVAVTQYGFQHDTDRHRQAGDVDAKLLLQGRQ